MVKNRVSSLYVFCSVTSEYELMVMTGYAYVYCQCSIEVGAQEFYLFTLFCTFTFTHCCDWHIMLFECVFLAFFLAEVNRILVVC